MTDLATIEWHRVASTEDFRSAESKAITLKGRSIGLFRVADAYYAIDDICTHEFALFGSLRTICASCLVKPIVISEPIASF